MIMVDAQIWDVKNVFEVLFSDVVNVILFHPSPPSPLASSDALFKKCVHTDWKLTCRDH